MSSLSLSRISQRFVTLDPFLGAGGAKEPDGIIPYGAILGQTCDRPLPSSELPSTIYTQPGEEREDEILAFSR